MSAPSHAPIPGAGPHPPRAEGPFPPGTNKKPTDTTKPFLPGTSQRAEQNHQPLIAGTITPAHWGHCVPVGSVSGMKGWDEIAGALRAQGIAADGGRPPQAVGGGDISAAWRVEAGDGAVSDVLAAARAAAA